MECAICLHSPILQEAYLHPCFHAFHLQCIRAWSEQQRRHGPDDTPCAPSERCVFTCPLCRRPYTHIVYDCIGASYRLLPMCGQAQTMSAMPLTAEQRRRRSLYVTPHRGQPAAASDQPASAALATADSSQLRRAARPRPPGDQQTSAWLQRELQAVLLADDVGVIVQHVLGVLQQRVAAAGRQERGRRGQPHDGGASNGGDSSPLYGSRQVFCDCMAQAVDGFLGEHAGMFAQQLWAFLHSGLSIAAHDRQVFGDRLRAAVTKHLEEEADTGQEQQQEEEQQQLRSAADQEAGGTGTGSAAADHEAAAGSDEDGPLPRAVDW